MTPDEIKEVLAAHAQWLKDPTTGNKADLRGADLRRADLTGADLGGVIGYVPMAETKNDKPSDSGSSWVDWV